MSKRPSKKALYHYLKRDLRGQVGGIGVDAAAANMKNHWMFQTDLYVGLDVSLDLLRQGVRNKPNAIGVLADLADLNLPDNCVDLCVSTNTFEALLPENQRLMAAHLARIVKPDGVLLFNKHCDQAWPGILAVVQGAFAQVEIVYYRNLFSQWYETHCLSETGGSFWRKPLVAFLSWVEYATFFLPWFNEGVYVRCRQKHRRGPDHPWSVTNLEWIEENLYRCSPPKHPESSVTDATLSAS